LSDANGFWNQGDSWLENGLLMKGPTCYLLPGWAMRTQTKLSSWIGSKEAWSCSRHCLGNSTEATQIVQKPNKLRPDCIPPFIGNNIGSTFSMDDITLSQGIQQHLWSQVTDSYSQFMVCLHMPVGGCIDIPVFPWLSATSRGPTVPCVSSITPYQQDLVLIQCIFTTCTLCTKQFYGLRGHQT